MNGMYVMRMKIATINEVDFCLFCSLLTAYCLLDHLYRWCCDNVHPFKYWNAYKALLQFTLFIIFSWFILSLTDECISFRLRSIQQIIIHIPLGICEHLYKFLMVKSTFWTIDVIHKRSILRAFEFYVFFPILAHDKTYLVWTKTTPEWIEYQ